MIVEGFLLVDFVAKVCVSEGLIMLPVSYIEMSNFAVKVCTAKAVDFVLHDDCMRAFPT